MDIAKAVSEIKAGKVEYRVDKDGNIHVSIARCSFDTDKIIDNLNVICDQIVKVKVIGIDIPRKRISLSIKQVAQWFKIIVIFHFEEQREKDVVRSKNPF